MTPDKIQPAAITGVLSAAGLRIGVVVSRFNQFITDRLLAGALDALERSGAAVDQIEVVRVPGAFEIPVAAKQLAEARHPDAVICIGCVIRGDTAHYEYVAGESARGIQLAQMDTGVPMIFCVLTCENLEQAIDRAGLKMGNKGFEAGITAIEMANLSRQLSGSSGSGASAAPPVRRSGSRSKSSSRKNSGRGGRR
jgi:6,7-dimethyl-8-ribityllumazine synthase